jgi:hypothetical protein
MGSNTLGAVAACAGTILWSAAVSASIVGVSGAVELVAAPADARANAYTWRDGLRCWDERQNVALEADLFADATEPGLYDWYTDLTGVVIPAGTIISSHYVHFDSPGSEMVSAAGSLTFSGRIVGVIVSGDYSGDSNGRLDQSDALGLGTVYPEHMPYRGLEFEIDRFEITTDRRTLNLSLRISQPGDYLRVFTVEPVPAPGGMIVMAGLLAAARRRR